MPFQILPVNIKSLAGSVATLANWLTSFIVTMTANLLLNWSNGGLSLSLPVEFCAKLDPIKSIPFFCRNLRHLRDR